MREEKIKLESLDDWDWDWDWEGQREKLWKSARIKDSLPGTKKKNGSRSSHESLPQNVCPYSPLLGSVNMLSSVSAPNPLNYAHNIHGNNSRAKRSYSHPRFDKTSIFHLLVFKILKFTYLLKFIDKIKRKISFN